MAGREDERSEHTWTKAWEAVVADLTSSATAATTADDRSDVASDVTSDADALRFQRGAQHYQDGAVRDVELSVSSAFAKVYGTNGDAHPMSIHVRPFPAGVWNRFFTLIVGHPEVCTQLSQGHLPHRVNSLMEELGVHLLPTAQEIELSCDCTEGENLCEHAYAFLLQITEEIDLNPLRLVLFRGMPESIWFERIGQSAARAFETSRHDMDFPSDEGHRNTTVTSTFPHLPWVPHADGHADGDVFLHQQHNNGKPVEGLWQRAKENTYWYGPLLSQEERSELMEWDPLQITLFADPRSQFAVHRFSKPPFPLARQDAMTELRDVYRQVSEAAVQILKEDLGAKAETDD